MIEQLLPFEEFSRRDCFEFRMGIEGEAAAMAARNRSDADLATIWTKLKGLEQVHKSNALGFNEDFSFHIAVAQASGNGYFVGVLNSLKQTIFKGMLLARATTGMHKTEKLAAINNQHRLIYDAIVDRDDERARRLMRGHLWRSKKSTSHWDVYSVQSRSMTSTTSAKTVSERPIGELTPKRSA